MSQDGGFMTTFDSSLKHADEEPRLVLEVHQRFVHGGGLIKRRR